MTQSHEDMLHILDSEEQIGFEHLHSYYTRLVEIENELTQDKIIMDTLKSSGSSIVTYFKAIEYLENSISALDVLVPLDIRRQLNK